MRAPEIGEISKAIYEGYRIAVHDRFFPFNAQQPDGRIDTVHNAVDHGARAIFCSREWFDSLPKVEA